MKIVVLCGPKRCGKDTAADYLRNNHGYIKVAIADNLKQACQIMFNLSKDQVEHGEKDIIDGRYGVTPRNILQFMGTEVMQYKINELIPTLGRTLWINTLIDQMNTLYKHAKIVITDMRFLHECTALLNQYGSDVVFIKIVKPDVLGNDCHVSENEFNKIPVHHVLKNQGTIDAYHENIKQLINQI